MACNGNIVERIKILTVVAVIASRNGRSVVTNILFWAKIHVVFGRKNSCI